MTVMCLDTRGVHYFEGVVRSPLAGVGSRADYASNRLVLDHGDSVVTVDRERGRIVVRNAAHYREKTHVLDLLLQAEGIAESGERKPVAVHLKVARRGRKLSIDLHRHLRTQERLVDAVFDPYDVVLYDEDEAHVLLTPARIRTLICKPKFALLVVKFFMAMRDNLEGQRLDLTRPGTVVDFEMGFGVLGRDWMLVRATLDSLKAENAELVATGDKGTILQQGAWKMSLTALSERWLPEVVIRDLFLFGLEDVELLAEVRRRGLRAHQTMAFEFDGGEGRVHLDDRSAPFAGALDTARDYMEFHLLGGLIAEHLEALAADG